MTRIIIVIIILCVINASGYGQKKFRDVQKNSALPMIEKNTMLVLNYCPFDVKFQILHQDGKKTGEKMKADEISLYRLEASGQLTIIRSKDKPNHGDTYNIFERRKYVLEFDKVTDIVRLVELRE